VRFAVNWRRRVKKEQMRTSLVKRFMLALSLVTVSVMVSLVSGRAFGAIEMVRPVDPFANLGEGEKLTFSEQARSLRYLNLIVQYDVFTKKPTAFAAAHVLDAAREYAPKFGDFVNSSPLALLNGSLYRLHIQYRNHTPVFEGDQIHDSPSHVEMRAFTLASARVLIAAIAKLPDQKEQIDLEFRRQRSSSDPHLVLASYLIPPPNADGSQPDPLFGGELESDLKNEIAKIGKSRTFTSRLIQNFRSKFSAKSCRESFF
jgi:hypothetical protein